MSSIVAAFTVAASSQAAALLEIIHKEKTPTAILRSCKDLCKFNFIASSFLDLISNTAFDDKIYYELDKIHQNHFAIENYLFNQTYLKNSASCQYIDYDLSTSYFVGYTCKLSAFGKGKIECRGRRQVLLGVLINNEGYFFKWNVFPGNTAEVKTLKTNIDACKTRFKLSGANVTLVFDRGVISDDNAN